MTETAEPDFDVIVVGAGIAGCVTAYQLARQERSVLLIERGEAPGAKNLSGGVLYSRGIQEVFPDFLAEAPVERRITRNCVSFLNAGSSVGIDYQDERLANPVNAVTVLRAKLDAWLAGKCEEAGVIVMPGVRVDRVLTEDAPAAPAGRAGNGATGKRVVGVQAGDDELRARVVVAADGVNSFLARDAGLRHQDPPNHLAVGVKSVVSLPRETIEARFNLTGDEGAALAVVGDCTEGVGGGGFLYTNTDSLSIGIVVRLDDLTAKKKVVTDIFDHFLEHRYIAPYLEGGEAVRVRLPSGRRGRHVDDRRDRHGRHGGRRRRGRPDPQHRPDRARHGPRGRLGGRRRRRHRRRPGQGRHVQGGPGRLTGRSSSRPTPGKT